MIHTVRQGESLSSIAQKYYMDISRWPDIASANGIQSPYIIFPGQELLIPDQAEQPDATAHIPESKKLPKATIAGTSIGFYMMGPIGAIIGGGIGYLVDKKKTS